MKLIEALVVAQQEYGIYQWWRIQHTDGARIDRTGCDGGWYYSYDPSGTLISQAQGTLETVIARLAEKYPDVVLSKGWKVTYHPEKMNAPA